MLQLLPQNLQGRQITYKMTEFSKKMEKDSVFEFEPFFITLTGYNMCFTVYANGCGDGRGTHISVFTRILNGLYDERLL